MTAQTHTAAAAPTAPTTQPRPRLLHFDNLRIALTALVVIHHAAITYGNIPFWFYVEPADDSSGLALDILALTNQSYFMGFFFLISGYFVPASFNRKGPRAFLRGRFTRLGIPLLVFLIALRPILTLNSYVASYDTVPYWLYYIVSWDPGPMWFVEVLLVFCLGYLLVRRLFHSQTTDTSNEIASDSPPPRRLPHPLSIIGFAIVLGITTYVWRAIMTAPYWPIVGLPSPGFLPQYLALFIVGVYAYRKGWLDSISRAATIWGAVTAVASLLVYVPTMAMAGEVATEWSPVMLANSLAESGVAVGAILFGIGLFQRVANTQNAFARFLSENAFAVYFVHPLILVAGGYALSAWDGTAIQKFAVLALMALPLCWITARAMRAIPAARRIF